MGVLARLAVIVVVIQAYLIYLAVIVDFLDVDVSAVPLNINPPIARHPIDLHQGGFA